MSGCPQCRPDWFNCPRWGENHLGVRFGDRAPGAYEIEIDGQRVENETVELLANRQGEIGWVIRVPLPARLCPCGSGHPMHEMDWGNVAVRRLVPDAERSSHDHSI